MEKVWMSYLFSFLRYWTKCVIKFLFEQLMALSTWRFNFDQSLKQLRIGEKWGEDVNTKIWISKERRAF